MGNYKKGVLFTFAAIILYATIAPVAKMMYLDYPDMPYKILVQVRMPIAGLFFFIIQFIKDKSALKITKSELLYLAILGIVGLFGVQYTLFAAVKRTPVGLASFIQSGATLFICAYSVLFLKEKFSFGKILSLFIGFTGITMIFWNREAFLSGNVLGVGLVIALLSAMTRAFYVIWGKRNKTHLAPTVMLAYAFSIGGLFSWLLGPFEMVSFFKQNASDYRIYVYFFLLSIFGTVLAFYCSFKGLSYVPASTNAFISITEPMFATIATYFLMGEIISLREGIGCALIALSAACMQVKLKTPQKLKA